MPHARSGFARFAWLATSARGGGFALESACGIFWQ